VLRPGEASWVQLRLRSAIRDAYQRLASADVDRGAVAGWLLDRYDAAGTLTQFVVDVRGLQIAALWHGLLVQVDVPALLGTAVGAPSAAARTPEVWRRLRAYRLPVRGAACALAAARLDVETMLAVTVANTALDGVTVATSEGVISIEAGAVGYVAAQRLLRGATGAAPGATLLADPSGKPLGERAVARLVSAARAELGIVVTSRLIQRAAPDGSQALRRWGITVTPIGDRLPRAPDIGRGGSRQQSPSRPPAGTPAAQLDVDVELLRQRRTELQLSRRDVAKRLGSVAQ
jgi:hypothetical protein